MSKQKLYIKTISSTLIFFGILATLILGIAGTIDYWQGWLYLCSFCLPTLFITLFFLKNDLTLIERRIQPTETRPQQIIGQSIAAILFFFGIIGFPTLDYKLGLSPVPAIITISALGVVIIGFMIVFFVFKENTYTSRAIEHVNNQKTITTGAYSMVRHPIYSGASLIIIATPLSLGSLLGLIPSFLLCIVIIFRILDEEKYLKQQLNGYTEYCQKLKYRLIPFIW